MLNPIQFPSAGDMKLLSHSLPNSRRNWKWLKYSWKYIILFNLMSMMTLMWAIAYDYSIRSFYRFQRYVVCLFIVPVIANIIS
jgi:hypothetical protein